jgi:hypothetical protein
VSVANLPFRCAGATPAAISLGTITPINQPIARLYGPTTTEMPVARSQAPWRAPIQAALCRQRAHHHGWRQDQIPIVLAAEPVPHFPRLRALALFGRRPPQCEPRLVIAGVQKPAHEWARPVPAARRRSRERPWARRKGWLLRKSRAAAHGQLSKIRVRDTAEGDEPTTTGRAQGAGRSIRGARPAKEQW